MQQPMKAFHVFQYQYSVCTIVSRREEYYLMLSAFKSVGFSSETSEFIYIDNAEGNQYDAYAAYNQFMLASKGEYLIFCHQDVLPLDHRQILDEKLAFLSQHEPRWAICGNAGVNSAGHKHVRISDPHGSNRVLGGPFPAEVQTLDENFLIIRRKANIGLSIDLQGFHWYGAEMCMVAELLGWKSFVIDYHVLHKSAGNPDEDYFAISRVMAAKYKSFFRSRWVIAPTEAQVYLSSSRIKSVYNRVKYKLLGKRIRKKRLSLRA